jgi:alpha-beta hydrolase superfamily lysophospholipase
MNATTSGSDPRPSIVRRLLRLVLRLIKWIAVILVTVYLVRAFDSRRGPELELWHTVSLEEEFRADDLTDATTLADYLAAEERLFQELDREVYAHVTPTPDNAISRYTPGSRIDPRGFPQDWNRTFELEPENLKGGALLVHGLTDSPYSLRRVAELLQGQGYYVLGLRLPGHGTIPASLVETSWKDWKAAVQVGVRHVASRVGEGVPLMLVGHSCGGALVVEYTASALLEDEGRVPDSLLLFSPAIGVTPFAVVSSWHRLVSFLPYFEKFRWMGIEPEYDPFKYVSFPKNGGELSYDLTVSLQKRMTRLCATPKIDRFPRTFAVQSLVDTTVLTEAIASRLFDRLPANGSELILFDINRSANVRPYLTSMQHGLLDNLESETKRLYRLTLITNDSEETLQVQARKYEPGETSPSIVPTQLSWPRGVYSLSHIAMPFPPDDPWYGDGSGTPEGETSLGTIQPRGERGMLRVSVGNLMRLRYNPFFGYVEDRLTASMP